MQRSKRLTVLCAAFLLLGSMPATAEENKAIGEYSWGTFKLDFRYRYETVDQDDEGEVDDVAQAIHGSTTAHNAHAK